MTNYDTSGMSCVTLASTVHYVAYGTPGGEFPCTCRAAIVTGVSRDHPWEIDLAVLNPTGMFFNRMVRFHPGDPAVRLRTFDAAPGTTCTNSGNAGDRLYPGGSWHIPEIPLEGEDS